MGFVGGFVVVVFGFSAVLDVGQVAGIAVHLVRDRLKAAVGQRHVVRAGHDFAVAVFMVAKVVVRRVVLDGVTVLVRTGGLSVQFIQTLLMLHKQKQL